MRTGREKREDDPSELCGELPCSTVSNHSANDEDHVFEHKEYSKLQEMNSLKALQECRELVPALTLT
jgi:hypothetical protein